MSSRLQHTEHLMKLAGHLGKVNAYAAGTGGGGSGGGPGGGGTHERRSRSSSSLPASSLSWRRSCLARRLRPGYRSWCRTCCPRSSSSALPARSARARNRGSWRCSTTTTSGSTSCSRNGEDPQHDPQGRPVRGERSQAAQSSASLSTIMGSAGNGPVSSAFLLASMKIDLAGIRRFSADIKKLEKLGLDKGAAEPDHPDGARCRAIRWRRR